MNFLVFIEQRDGKIRKASLEALSLARKLGGGPAAAVIAGKGVAGLVKDLGKYGAGTVYVADRDELALYSNKGYVGALDAAAATVHEPQFAQACVVRGADVLLDDDRNIRGRERVQIEFRLDRDLVSSGHQVWSWR